MLPITVSISGRERPDLFLWEQAFDGDKLVKSKLYNTYDDIKDCLIRDRDINTYATEEWYFRLEIKKIDDPCIVDMARMKLETCNHDSLGLPIEIGEDLQEGDKNSELSTPVSFYPPGDPVILNGMKEIKAKFGVSAFTVRKWVQAGAPIIVHNAKDNTGTYSQQTGGAIRYSCDYHRLYDWLLENQHS